MRKMRSRNRRMATLGFIVLLSAGLSLDNMLKDRQKIKKEIVFIAPNLKNKSMIADELAGDAMVVYLSGDTRGLEQIAAYLKTQRDIETVRIFSHGDDGLLDLPGLPLSSENIDAWADELHGWKEALATDADILLYGCNVAATEKGQHFVNQLAQLTGADVAASTNRSGGAENEWALEFASGNIEASEINPAGFTEYLETFTVTSNGDSGAGSLRQAIADAVDGDDIVFNLTAGSETIVLSSELTIDESLTLDGDNTSGSGTHVTISGNNACRVLNLSGSGKTIILQNLNITGGNSITEGGGIYLNSTRLYILNSTISGNTSSTRGGAISNNNSSLTIQNSTIAGNSVSNASEAVKGGGIFSDGFMKLENSTISGNTASSANNSAQGGGIYSKTMYNYSTGGTSFRLYNCTISQNTVSGSTGSAQGAGVFHTNDGETPDYIYNSIIAQNVNNSANYDYYIASGTNVQDQGYNVVEYCNMGYINFKYFDDARSILYNTRYGNSGTLFSSWSQGGVELSNQTLGLASTLADNGGPTQTLALAEGSFAAASFTSGIPAAYNWHYSPEINGQYTDQRGVARIPGRNTSIGAYSANFDVPTNTWTGASNTSWNNNSNWSLNSIPNEAVKVQIVNAENDPIISTPVECNELIIASGANLRIAPTGTLKVNVYIENNNGTAGLVLESDNSGTGKLVNNTDGVQATVRQYIVKDQWHYVSSPISDLTDINAVFNKFYVIKNDESLGLDNPWVYLQQGEGMNPGKGYGVMWNRSHKPEEVGYTDQIVSFEGILNTGDIYPSMSYSGHGWNFLGNPYPCTIDWEVLKTQAVHINDAIYVWNPSLSGENKYGRYGTYVDGVAVNGQTQYIAPMQGFFVKPDYTAGYSLKFVNDAKTTETSTFKSVTVQHILRLALIDANGATDESVIRIHPAATEAFDGKLDAYKLKANSLTPQLYSVLNGDEYSINSLSEVGEQTVVPFELMIKQSGQHTLALTELTGYNKALPIMLFSEAGQLLADLQSGAYTFTAQAGEVIKVKLAFSNVLASAKTLSNPFLRVAVDGNNLNLSGLGQGRSTVQLFNSGGQLLQNHQTRADALQIPNLNCGVYLLRVKDSYGMQQVKKVVIQ